MQRANVDFPAPDGPNTTVTLPGAARILTLLRMGSALCGAIAVTSRSNKAPVGGTRTKAGSRSGFSSSRFSSRSKAARAPMKLRQVLTNKSIGARVRVISTLAAIMAPGDSWPSITSNAPAPRASDC